MGYSDDTTKHLKIYAPDLGRIILSSRVSVDESASGGTVDLRLRVPQGLNRIPIDSPDRVARGRPRKEATAQELLYAKAIEGESLHDILMFDEDENGNIR